MSAPTPVPCTRCNGSGGHTSDIYTADGVRIVSWQQCSACGGTGRQQ